MSDLAEPTVANNVIKSNGQSGIIVQDFAGGEILSNRISDNNTNVQLLVAAPRITCCCAMPGADAEFAATRIAAPPC